MSGRKSHRPGAPYRTDRTLPSTPERNCARVAALLSTAVLTLCTLVPSASADEPGTGLLGLEGSGRELNINFDIAQTVWTVLASPELKQQCQNGLADTGADGLICPYGPETEETVDAGWGIGGQSTT